MTNLSPGFCPNCGKPAAANGVSYSSWIADFELREDGRWYFVSFVVPEADG